MALREHALSKLLNARILIIEHELHPVASTIFTSPTHRIHDSIGIRDRDKDHASTEGSNQGRLFRELLEVGRSSDTTQVYLVVSLVVLSKIFIYASS